MQELIRGAFHFHSTYSHDGRSTLAQTASTLHQRGFSFCIMTEHFEDFDPPKFKRYIEEVNALNRQGGFVLIPGIEANLGGIDTILFPVVTFDECFRFAAGKRTDRRQTWKVLAHPSRYPFDQVSKHLETFEIDAIELWNQQADGYYMPPLDFLESLKGHAWRNRYYYLFGCDLHDVSLSVCNIVTMQQLVGLSSESITTEMTRGRFVSVNVSTGIEYPNERGEAEFDEWLERVRGMPFGNARLLRSIRLTLKGIYQMMPRPMRHSLNDLKNLVRNKI
jgi:hypothetical protein